MTVCSTVGGPRSLESRRLAVRPRERGRTDVASARISLMKPEPRIFTRTHWLEVARILAVGGVAAMYWRGVVPLPVLLGAVAVGLYPLVKKGARDLVREREIGTEIFITLATVIALIGREYVAAAILLA